MVGSWSMDGAGTHHGSAGPEVLQINRHDSQAVLDLFIGAALDRLTGSSAVAGSTMDEAVLGSASVRVLIGDQTAGSRRVDLLHALTRRRPSTTTQVLVARSTARCPFSRELLTGLAAAQGHTVRTAFVRLDGVAVLTPGHTLIERGGRTQRFDDPSLRASFTALFDTAWQSATDLQHHRETSRSLSHELRTQVLGLLRDGVKDDSAARVLRVSVRTYRRYVSRVMEELDATSRFQAGVRAACAGLIDQ